MTVKNPTDKEITVVLSGKTFTVPAEGVVREVPAKDAKYWTESLHNFLTLSEDTLVPVIKEEKKDKVDEKIEEIIEDIKEEVKEEEKKEVEEAKEEVKEVKKEVKKPSKKKVNKVTKK